MTARPGNPQLAESIIRATAEIVEERGPDGVTMRAVAQRIGYSPTTIYLYFDNKDDLLRQTLARVYSWLLETVTDAGGGPRDQLSARAGAYVTWAIDHPGLYRFMYQSDVLAPADEQELAARVGSWEAVRDIASAIQAQGGSRVSDPRNVTTVLWSAVHGIATLAISGRLFLEEMPPETVRARALELTETLVSMCFEGAAG